MSTLSNSEVIVALMGQYSEGIIYGEFVNTMNGKSSVLNNGFIGSKNVVFISGKDSVTHEAPGCVAAPVVTMIAKNAISLGMTGQGSQPVPFRLFAQNLSITTSNLSIGEIKFVNEPQHAFFSCNTLTLLKFTDEDPDYFEIVKSWVLHDYTEVITTRR